MSKRFKRAFFNCLAGLALFTLLSRLWPDEPLELLRHYFEQGLAMGMTEEEAEEYAYEKFDGGMDY